MNITTVRINSYFGNSPELIEIRKKAHETQVDFWLNAGYDIVIFAYKYQPEWFIKNDKIRYITTPNDQKVLIAGARNILLKDFYSSNENYSFFLDNDAILYTDTQHVDGKDFFNVFNKVSLDDLQHVDCFCVVDPRQSPFSDYNKKNKEKLENNLIFNISTHLKGTMFCLKNLKKFHDKEFYMDDENFKVGQGHIEASEDRFFANTLLWNGLGNYELRNLILKEIVPDDSTWLPSDMTRAESVSKESKYYDMMIKTFGLKMNKNGLDYTKIKTKSQKPNQVFVKKDPSKKSFFDD